jgi:dimethylargininase
MDANASPRRFTRAIVRTPSRSMINGLTQANLGFPDYSLALRQHEHYQEALQQAGLEVRVLPADEANPDSTFVEDVALLTSACAVVMSPGAPSRRRETQGWPALLTEYYKVVETVPLPATIEAGDIMMAGTHFYIGLSERTNSAGAERTLDILSRYGMTGTATPVGEILHLKTGVSYLENNMILVCGALASKPEFQKFNIIEVPADEPYAANSVWINGFVLVPEGHPKTARAIAQKGYSVLTVDVSEFRKLDGGLSCLSLRF